MLDSKVIKQNVYAHDVRITTSISLHPTWDMHFPYTEDGSTCRLFLIELEWSPLNASSHKSIRFFGHKLKKNGEPGNVQVTRHLYLKDLEELDPALRAIIGKGFEEAPTIV